MENEKRNYDLIMNLAVTENISKLAFSKENDEKNSKIL